MAALGYFVLTSDAVRERAQAYLWACPVGVVLKFETQAKSREQECHYHAIISEIAETQTVQDADDQPVKLDPDSWKRLLIDAFKYDTWNDPDLRPEWKSFGSVRTIPALNHPGYVTMGEQSRKFSKKLAAAFITWLQEFQDSSEET